MDGHAPSSTCPTGASHDSPRHCLGTLARAQIHRPIGARHLISARVCCPVGATDQIGAESPGRCPGLSCVAPMGRVSHRGTAANWGFVIRSLRYRSTSSAFLAWWSRSPISRRSDSSSGGGRVMLTGMGMLFSPEHSTAGEVRANKAGSKLQVPHFLALKLRSAPFEQLGHSTFARILRQVRLTLSAE